MRKGELESSSLKSFAHRLNSLIDSVQLHLVRRLRTRWSKRTLKWWLQFLVFMEPDPKHTVIESPTAVIAVLCLVPTAYVCASTFLFLYALTFGALSVPLITAIFAGGIYTTLLTLHIIYDR